MDSSSQKQTLAHQINALSEGSGSLVVLLPGWPETIEAYREVLPALTARHRVLALDPPGLGGSVASPEGYDTARIGRMLADAVHGVANESYHLVGHDVGSWIAYAWAAQFPQRLKSLTMLDAAVPGCSAPQTFPLSYEVNVKLWQFSFNTLPDLPEVLTQGRERELFEWLFQHKAQHPERITQAKRDHYIESYSRPGAMSRGFAYYRDASKSALQNIEFAKTKLEMPVLALGGTMGAGALVRKSMEALAVHVEGGVIDDCGHYMMEEQPEAVSKRLLEFFEQVEAVKP